MYAVEVYAAVRRFVLREGNSRREAARVFGISRTTVDKICAYSAPPGYQRTNPPAKPKLDPFVPIIDAVLQADEEAPRKQRHTARRIFERIRDEHGYDGGYTIVADYVREARQRTAETFVPLHHPPGHAQVDFGEAIGVIGGQRCKLLVFFMDLPYSDAAFMKAYPAETTEAFLDGHVAALAFFGGIPQSILYDNTKLAVAKICGDGTRERTRAFTSLVSHYLFTDRFGRPGKGNDKGKVEGLVKNGRRRFLTPVPVAASFAELNVRLEAACLADQDRKAGRHEETIGERLLSDLSAFEPLPVAPFEPCEVRTARVSSTSLVRYRSNDYSVPTTHGYRSVTVKGFVDEVVILAGSPVLKQPTGDRTNSHEIAHHPRSYERGGFVFDPLHYLALIEQKPGALDQAAPLQGWELPDQFDHLRRLLERRSGNKGKRVMPEACFQHDIQVLRLMEVFDQDLVGLAVAQAIKLGALSFDAVKQIAVARIERRPPRLDLERYPHLPKADVAMMRAGDYTALMQAGAS